MLFFPAIVAMMAAFTIAQHVRHSRYWLAVGVVCFAVCVGVLIDQIGIGTEPLVMMLQTLSQKVIIQ